jgi:hypothetical protein
LRKTTILPSKQGKCCFKVLNIFLTQNLRPFEGFSQDFRLILRFWNMTEVGNDKNGVLLLFNVIFFTF